MPSNHNDARLLELDANRKVNESTIVELASDGTIDYQLPSHPTSKDLQGCTALHIAAKHEDLDAIRLLLKNGADVTVKDARGMTPLHRAVECERSSINDRLVHELRGPLKDSPVDALLSAHLDYNVTVNPRSSSGTSHLAAACIGNNVEAVEHFPRSGVSADECIDADSPAHPGYTPLHLAARHCSAEVARVLLEHGAQPRPKDAFGSTPLRALAKSAEKLTALDVCSCRHEAEVVRDLIDSRAEWRDIRLSDGRTRLVDLVDAMRSGEELHRFVEEALDVVNVLVPHDSPIFPGYTPLHFVTVARARTKSIDDLFKNTQYSTKSDESEVYNCDEGESDLYTQRIDVILERSPDFNDTVSHGSTALHLAFGMPSRDTTKKLLRRDKESVVDQKGLSHLHIACALGQLKAVERYVVGGADVNARTGLDFSRHVQFLGEIRVRANSTPLHVAVLFGYNNTAKYLLKNKADVQAADSLGFTPIHLSISRRYRNVAELLLDAALPNLRDSVCAAGLSHLRVAAYADHPEAVKQLLLGGADIERLVDKDIVEKFSFSTRYAGKTPLHVAFDVEAGRAVEILLRAGANVHVKDCTGTFLLHKAVFYYNSCSPSQPFFRFLKKCEKSDDVESDGITLLHAACAIRDLEWAERLLDQGADVNARVCAGEQHGSTPLHVTVDGIHNYTTDRLRECYSFIKLLVDRGADASIKDDFGLTPLCLIYQNIFTDNELYQFSYDHADEFLLRSVDLLLTSQKSYRVNPIGEHGYSHFHLACLRNNVEAATKFLDHGVDVNLSIDPFDNISGGLTPLHFAITYERTEVAHLLLQRGADVNAKDTCGNTPLHAAFESGSVNLPLIEAMIRRGADVCAKNVWDSTPLHSLVGRYDNWTPDEYLNVIERTGMESCLYQQDEDGNTPLHTAMNLNNPTAMEALFCIGFNINSIDLGKECQVDAINQPIEERRMNVTTKLARHLWKIRFLRLDLTDSNLRFLISLEEQFSPVALLEQPCQDELTKAKKTEICEGVTVNDFLSELGAAAAYPTMHPIRRAIVNEYFKCIVDLYHEFPEFCGLLVLQYRKALNRLELMQPAKEAIASIFQVELPDLCSEAVLRYFTNGEMKVVIEAAEKLFV